MCVRERLLTGILKVQIHESENIYDRQAQLDKAAVEMRRRRGGFNFQRRRLPTFFCKDDDIVPTSNKITWLYYLLLVKYLLNKPETQIPFFSSLGIDTIF